MSVKRERRRILSRVGSHYNMNAVQIAAGCDADELADALLKLKEVAEACFGGPMLFTGNNRTYRNGAIGYEVRCRGCGGLYWYVSGFPDPYCRDCPAPKEK